MDLGCERDPPRHARDARNNLSRTAIGVTSEGFSNTKLFKSFKGFMRFFEDPTVPASLGVRERRNLREKTNWRTGLSMVRAG